MSRIGKKEIVFSKDTLVSKEKDNLIIKNKDLSVVVNIPSFFLVVVDENAIKLSKLDDKTTDKHIKAMYGTKRQEINNAIIGLEQGFSRKLKLFGVGYGIVGKEDCLDFSLGFSHIVKHKKNKDLSYQVINRDTFVISGINKQVLGQEVSIIKKLRKRNVYDCYGIYDIDEPRIPKTKKKKK